MRSWGRGRLEGVRVLFVEDDDDSRELGAEVFRSAGAEVMTARTGNEGYCVFERERPDLIVSDLWMPNGDGYSMMRRIRALAPVLGGETPSIATSAMENATHALKSGFQRLITKPIDIDTLIDAAEQFMRERPRSDA